MKDDYKFPYWDEPKKSTTGILEEIENKVLANIKANIPKILKAREINGKNESKVRGGKRKTRNLH